MASSFASEKEKRNNASSNSMFELLLFRLGQPGGALKHELFGINVFKVREIMVMPDITSMVNAGPNVMGIANVRGQLIPVVNLPKIVGCNPVKGLGILLVTEFARTTQAFAVEEVVEIVCLDWKQALSAEGTGGGLVTSLARLDGDKEGSRLAQVLDVEQILRDVFPDQHHTFREDTVMPKGSIPAGSVILAADDSAVARMMIEQALKAMNLPVVMTRSGKEAWEKLFTIQAQAQAQGVPVRDRVALVLTDLEMPEMDGFTLTRNIKDDPRFDGIPVMIHSSLSGTATENHARSAGADAYVGKFVAEELGSKILEVVARSR
ncbi:MAG: chemotaxis protein CheV [Rhodoferax sp.]|nr:chemotaxis protein CheV [Rhodoferax sp.]